MGGRCHNGRPFASCAINPSGIFRGCLRSYLMISTENEMFLGNGAVCFAPDFCFVPIALQKNVLCD